MKLVLATGNSDKLKEMKALLAKLPIEVTSKDEMGFADLDVDETGETLEDNAELKARALYEATGEWVLADDTGLFVDALDGAPGVYSARYAGEHATYEDNRKRLLSALEGVDDRSAAFRTVVCLIDKAGQAIFLEGVCPGAIAVVERGEMGFGYDSIFVPEGWDRSFAEMTDEEKNAISHRGNALALVAKGLEKWVIDHESGGSL